MTKSEKAYQAPVERIVQHVADQLGLKEVTDWQQAALRIGEGLASVGPDSYYQQTAQQWLTWALAAVWHKNERIAVLEREISELKAFHYGDSAAKEPLGSPTP